MDQAAILEIVSRTVGGAERLASKDGMATIGVAREQLVDACRALRDAPELGFTVLIDMVPYDFYPREPRFEISYLLLAPGAGGQPPKRLRVKIRVPGTDAHVPTLSGIWRAANWAEREAYDFFGIHIDGHPDLRRILMPEDWEGFPLRKDYPVQINQPVKTYQPLQVSAEEFAANIENARDRSKV